MYTLHNLTNVTLVGDALNSIQPVPGKIFCPPNTLAKGTVLIRRTKIKWTAPVDDNDPNFHIRHLFDGDLYMDFFAVDTASFNVGFSPGLFEVTSFLFVGNDGNLYNSGRYVFPADLVAATSNLFGNGAGYINADAMGPIDATQLLFTGTGASEYPPPFDFYTLGHEFTTEIEIEINAITSVDPALYTVEILHDSLEVYEGINGNTAAQ